MNACEECHELKTLRNTAGNKWRMACACEDLSEFEPKTRASIIVPSKYPDIFQDCHDTISKFAPRENKILVRDGHDIVPPSDWKTIQGAEGKFVYSRNINLGIKQSTGDVLLTNDDVRFTHTKTLEIMQNVLHQHLEVGILSPLIKGDVGEYWQSHATKALHYTDVRLCFVCVLVREEVLDKIGLLDENFDGYGYDDVDYCRRIKDAGWKLGVTARAVVKHGHGKDFRSASYNRQQYGTIEQLDKRAQEVFKEKWGDLNLT